MPQFRSSLIFLLLLPFVAQAKIAQPTPEQVRRFFASRYAASFAMEFNSSKKAEDLKALYSALYPAKYRKQLLNFNMRPIVWAKGPVIFVQVGSLKPAQLEIVDLYQQQFKINGKKYARDWNADPLNDVHVIYKKLQGPEAQSLMDYFLPKSEAGPEVVAAPIAEAGIALVVLADVVEAAEATSAIGAIAQSGTATTIAGATGDAATLAATRSGISGSISATWRVVQRVATDPELHALAERDFVERNQALWKWTVDNSAKAVEEMKAATAEMKEATKESLNAAKAAYESAKESIDAVRAMNQGPGPMTKFLKEVKEIGLPVGLVTMGAIGGHANSVSTQKNITYVTALVCEFYTLSACAQTVKASTSGPSLPLSPPTGNTCYNKESPTVETSGWVDINGGKNVYSIQFSSPDKDGNSAPTAAWGFIIGSNGTILKDSVRRYDISLETDPETKKDSLYVHGVTQVMFADDADMSKLDFLTYKESSRDSDVKLKHWVDGFKGTNDLFANKVAAETEIPKPQKNRPKDKKIFDEFHKTLDWSKQPPEVQGELQGVAQLMFAYPFLTKGCNELQSIDPKMLSAASLPGAKEGAATTH